MLGSSVDLGLDREVGARQAIRTRKPIRTGTAAGRCAGPASWPGSAADGWRARRIVLKGMRTTGPTPPMTLVGTAVAALACAPADRSVRVDTWKGAARMWRDRDPYRDHQYVPDTFWLVVATLLFAACGLVWLIGQVAAILFGAHQHLPVRLVDMLGVLLRLPDTWDDPAGAWPPSSQPLLPCPARPYATPVLTFWLPALLYGLLVRLISPRARRRRKQRGAKWAS